MGKSIIGGLMGSSQDAGSKTPQHIIVVDSSGTNIDTFGAGIQYTEGDVDSTPTGTAAMGINPSNVIKALELDANANLKVILASTDPAVSVLGATTGAKVITDANGTIQQYLRGLIYQLITAGASFFTPVPDTVNGWLVAMMTSADGSTALTNTAQAIKASAGKLGGWYIYNPNAVATYVHIYNTAAGSVTVGTTNPQMTLCIPASSGANVELAMGVPFSNAGWSAAATTTGPGNTAPSTALEAVFLYK